MRFLLVCLLILMGAGALAVDPVYKPAAPDIMIPKWTRSYQLYGQPHAIWLDRYDYPGANLPIIKKTLAAAKTQRQIPEFVVYGIPLRDLGQSSEGGFGNYEDYLEDNVLSARQIRDFVSETSIHPRVYLEPDSLPLAVQYRRDNSDNEESVKIYHDRIKVTRSLIELYRGAGATVYLEAGHGAWFDYGETDLNRIATILNAAGISQADGLASNVSNRQPVSRPLAPDKPHTELQYMARLLPLLDNKKLDVAVDTSRNGGITKARQYYLARNGLLIDNEHAGGRLVGNWSEDSSGEIYLRPFFGKIKPLSRLLKKEKYQYHPESRILVAPPWLDAVGDVKLGPAPTDQPPPTIAKVIDRYRYIKPPDDCDGALNCPPGASKNNINWETGKRQPAELPAVKFLSAD